MNDFDERCERAMFRLEIPKLIKGMRWRKQMTQKQLALIMRV